MAKKKRETREKPKEILELETLYGIILEQTNFDFDLFSWMPENSFTVNKSGAVNGLSLMNNTITDIRAINNFPELVGLNLNENLIEEISGFTENLNLQYLFLGNNRIKNIEALRKFPNLISLVLWSNPIEDIRPIKALSKLQGLHCENIGNFDFSFINNLKDLVRLDLSNNNIQILPIKTNLDNLIELQLNKNLIKDIYQLDKLHRLRFIHLQGNLLTEVSKTLAQKFNWLTNSFRSSYFSSQNRLLLYNNPLEFPPTSVIELGPATVQNYYEAAEQFGHAPLSEGRIIVIGDGSAGKSSLIEKMLYGSFEKGRAQTNGIKIEHFHLQHPEDNRDLVFHIWDFGGQEIQHAVHKFFFSEGCVYVLVLDNRREEEPDYWLQQIESLGGKAPVLVVFNKHDENQSEIADRKYLKEKYPNIIGFFNTSCLNGFGIDDFRNSLEKEVVKLRTVREQFPKNWLAIKKSIQAITTGTQHYLTYETYQAICEENNTPTESTQRLLLKYFNTIGAVTWFGEDTHLKFLHVLKPEWITQGVYKILTAKKTARLYGQIEVSDFKELLYPLQVGDYTYDEKHYGYILSMMKKFDLCDAPDDKHLLIPSAFGKMPKVEYSDFRGEAVSTYILQFKDYMPLALIHRFTAKNIKQALDSNYWYTGIVIRDPMNTGTLAMIHADKEAKRIYVRIKGTDKLGMWGHIRRELADITSSYAKIPYDELVALDDTTEHTVKYIDLTSYLKAGKELYFHPGLRKDFNVGYLMGLFENREATIEKLEKGIIDFSDGERAQKTKIPPLIIQILNNNSQQVNTHVSTQINIDINVQFVTNTSNELSGELNYLLSLLDDQNKVLVDILKDLANFATDAKEVQNSGEMVSKGWKRKLKGLVEGLGKSGETIKHIKEGSEVLSEIYKGLSELAKHFKWTDIQNLIDKINA